MLFDRKGTLLEHRDHALGIKHVSPGKHREAFDIMTQAWRRNHGPLPALLSGMIGSRHGWREVPYLACPASVAVLAQTLFRVPGESDVFIVPGLKMDGPRPDVLRGEELQVLGLHALDPSCEQVCIPGTHSKWIALERQIVREFHTAMTGELFSAIREHTLFAQLVPPATTSTPMRPAAFEAGLAKSTAPHGLLHALFELRAAILLGHLSPGDLADTLSGLLIGTELRHVGTLAPRAHRIAVLGAPGVGERYVQALRHFSFDARAFAVQDVTARGFVALAAALELIRPSPATG